MSHDPFCGERILEDFSAVTQDLPPGGNCSVPIMLGLIGTRQTLVRGILRILRHGRRERLDCLPEPSLSQSHLACQMALAQGRVRQAVESFSAGVTENPRAEAHTSELQSPDH